MSEERDPPRDIVIRLGDDGSRWMEEAQALAPLIAKVIGLGERETLSVMYCLSMAGRPTSIRYARAFAGVPVEPGDVFIELGMDGRINETRISVAAPIELPTAVPSLSAGDAERIVRELVAAAELPAVQGELWQRPWVLERTDLQVFGIDYPARLVWNSWLTVPTVSTLGAHILLDAHSGEVVTSWSTGCFNPGPHPEPLGTAPVRFDS
jgi:hypothetical protein